MGNYRQIHASTCTTFSREIRRERERGKVGEGENILEVKIFYWKSNFKMRRLAHEYGTLLFHFLFLYFFQNILSFICNLLYHRLPLYTHVFMVSLLLTYSNLLSIIMKSPKIKCCISWLEFWLNGFTRPCVCLRRLSQTCIKQICLFTFKDWSAFSVS